VKRSLIGQKTLKQEDTMQGKTLMALTTALLGAVASISSAAALPTCSQLATNPSYGLVGNPLVTHVVSGSVIATNVPAAAAAPASPPRSPTATPATPAFCQIDFTYSAHSGPADGYDVNQKQMIKIRISLPLNSVEGGSGGVQGNWNGKTMTSASAGSSSSVTSWAQYGEGLDFGSGPAYAIRLGYVGSSTDTGQGNPPFGVIQTGPLAHTLALGTIADWEYRATHYGKQFAVSLATAYYGWAPRRSYYNGCSGAGNEGMGQLQNFGNEYDGFVIGAPAYYWQQFRLADSWPQIVLKKLVQQGGALPSAAQISAANTAATAACDVQADDAVIDGVVADPRVCKFGAAANICGKANAPAAPNCLTPAQAAAIDRIWDGPRNRFGSRIWFPYDRGVSFTASTSVSSSTAQVMQWNHKDTTFNADNLYVDKESLALAGNPPGGITYEDEATLGSRTVSDYSDNQSVALHAAFKHGTKVIQVHGMQDGAIRWRHDVDYYRRVAKYFDFGEGEPNYKKLQEWYRLFPMPGVGHCTGALGGGAGPSVVDPFLVMVDWVEKGITPDSMIAQGGAGAPATRTRPLCPYPKTAIYNGHGSTDDARNFHCGGNLETRSVVCDDVRTRYKHENEAALDYQSIGAEFCHSNEHASDHHDEGKDRDKDRD
jgi:feruloyl esterase